MQISFNLSRKREGEEMFRVWIFHNQMIKYVNYECREYIFHQNISYGPRRMTGHEPLRCVRDKCIREKNTPTS